MPLNQLSAVAIEGFVALLFRKRYEAARAEQRADVRAVTPGFEGPHRFGELERSLLQHRRWNHAQLLDERIGFRQNRGGGFFLVESHVHWLRHGKEQPNEFCRGDNEV